MINYFRKHLDIAKVFIAAHVLWCLFHLVFVSIGMINPWKLGGYGMYTTPAYCPLPEIILLDEKNINYVPSNNIYSIYKKEMFSGCIAKPKNFYKHLSLELLEKIDKESLNYQVIFHHTILNKNSFLSEYKSSGKAIITIRQKKIVVEEILCGRKNNLEILMF